MKIIIKWKRGNAVELEQDFGNANGNAEYMTV